METVATIKLNRLRKTDESDVVVKIIGVITGVGQVVSRNDGKSTFLLVGKGGATQVESKGKSPF